MQSEEVSACGLYASCRTFYIITYFTYIYYKVSAVQVVDSIVYGIWAARCLHTVGSGKEKNTILLVHSFFDPRTWGHSRGCLFTDFPCGPLILIYSKTGSNLLLGHHCLKSLLTPFISLLGRRPASAVLPSASLLPDTKLPSHRSLFLLYSTV